MKAPALRKITVRPRISDALKKERVTVEKLAKSSPKTIRTLLDKQGVKIEDEAAEKMIDLARWLYAEQQVKSTTDWLKVSTEP